MCGHNCPTYSHPVHRRLVCLIGKVGENDQDKTGGKVAEVNVQDTQHEEQQELSFVSMSPSLHLQSKAGDIHCPCWCHKDVRTGGKTGRKWLRIIWELSLVLAGTFHIQAPVHDALCLRSNLRICTRILINVLCRALFQHIVGFELQNVNCHDSVLMWGLCVQPTSGPHSIVEAAER